MTKESLSSKQAPYSATVFRGTQSSRSEYRRSARGSFGPGIYFAGDSRAAEMYGEWVHLATVNLSSPWRVHADWDSELAHQEDFDSPCVDAVLTLPGGRELLDNAKAGDGLYGEDLLHVLKALGYDGVVATFPDGSQEIAAFDSRQVNHQSTFGPSHAESPQLADVEAL